MSTQCLGNIVKNFIIGSVLLPLQLLLPSSSFDRIHLFLELLHVGITYFHLQGLFCHFQQTFGYWFLIQRGVRDYGFFTIGNMSNTFTLSLVVCWECMKIPLGIVVYRNGLFSGKRTNVSLEDAVCTICLVCNDYYSHQVLFNNCTHYVCASCYDNDSLKACPICKTTKGPKPGRYININCSKYSLRQEVLDDYGVTPSMVRASNVSVDILGRRPGDLDDQQFDERLRHINRQQPSSSASRSTFSSRPTVNPSLGPHDPVLARTSRFRLVMPMPEYDSEDDFIIQLQMSLTGKNTRYPSLQTYLLFLGLCLYCFRQLSLFLIFKHT